MLQKINLGRYDRVARAASGLVAIVCCSLSNVTGWLLPVSLYALVTAAMGSCPIYSAIGFSTRRRGMSSIR